MALNLGTLFFKIVGRTEQLEQAEKKVDRSSKKMSKSFARLGAAISVAMGVNIAKGILKTGEAMTLLDVRLRQVSDSQQQFIKNQKELLNVADETGQSFGDIVQLFERIKLSTKEIGASNEEVLRLTESLNKLGVIGGSSTDEMNNALRQLSQAFSGGIVRAEEFNSIVENTPAIARSIADGLGVSVGELRKMVLNGSLFSDKVMTSILSQTKDIDERFLKLPRTSSMAFEALNNQASQSFKRIIQEFETSSFITKIMDSFTGVLPAITDAYLKFFNIVEFGYQSIGNFAVSASKKTKEIFNHNIKNIVIAFSNDSKRIKITWNNLTINLKSTWDKFSAFFEITSANMRAKWLIMSDKMALAWLKMKDKLSLEDNAQEIKKLSKEIQDQEKNLTLLSFEERSKHIDQLAENEKKALNEKHKLENGLSNKILQKKLSDIEKESQARRKAVLDELNADFERIDTGTQRQEKEKEEKKEKKEDLFLESQAGIDTANDILEKLGNETKAIVNAYNKRAKEIEAIQRISDKRRADLMKANEKKRNADMAKLQQAQFNSQISGASQFLSVLNSTLEQGGIKNKAVLTAIFMAQKAIQVAQIIAATEAAAAQAAAVASAGGPLPFFATQSAIRAMGYASAGMVAGMAIGQAVSGGVGRVNGGPAPSGLATPVVEDGRPELFTSAAGTFLLPPKGGGIVTPLNEQASGGGLQNVNITVVDNVGANVQANLVTFNELEIILDRRQEQTINQIDSSLSQAEGSTFEALNRSIDVNRRL